MVQLLGAIEDGPEAIRCCENHIDALEYFVQRSLRVELDSNDRDGLQRLVGDTEEVLTESDCEEMRSNPQIWRPYLVGWLGARADEMYAATLHPKEVAYLHQMQESIREEALAIASGVEEAHSEQAALNAFVGSSAGNLAMSGGGNTAMGERALHSRAQQGASLTAHYDLANVSSGA